MREHLTERIAGHPTDPTRPATAAQYLVQFTRAAMATEFQVFLPIGESRRHGEAAVAALDLIERLEDQLSVYREASEVSRLNQLARHAPFHLSPNLLDLLVRSRELWEATSGAFDITSSPLSEVWGFQRRQGMVPSESELEAALARVGSQWLELRSSPQPAAQFLRPGLKINLGAIGKGYALQQAHDSMVQAGAGHFLLHGGKSSVIGRGTPHPPGDDAGEQAAPAPPADCWWVGLSDPLRPEKRLVELRLHNRALATSGCGNQFFHHRGRRYGHILDPRSGLPAEGVLSVSVFSPSATDADALSTAFFILGPEEAGRYCERHPEVGALFVLPSGHAGRHQLVPVNLAEDDWERLPTE